jgi:hypothetical protein
MWYVRGKSTHYINVALQTTLLAQTVVILIASWMSLVAYEDAFGFTRDRLLSHYFLVVVACVLILLGVGAINQKVRGANILQGVIIIFAVALVGLNFVNPDKFIAEHNILRGDKGDGIDYEYLLSLSEDAAIVVLDGLDKSGCGMIDGYDVERIQSLADLYYKQRQNYKISDDGTAGVEQQTGELEASRGDISAIVRQIGDLKKYLSVKEQGVATCLAELRLMRERAVVDSDSWFEWNWSRWLSRDKIRAGEFIKNN